MFLRYLVDGWRDPEDFTAGINEDIALVADFVVAVGAAKRTEISKSFKSVNCCSLSSFSHYTLENQLEKLMPMGRSFLLNVFCTL
jgi:predicted transcriptional regulator